MAMPDWAPSFTLNELFEISDAVMPVLRGYLEHAGRRTEPWINNELMLTSWFCARP